MRTLVKRFKAASHEEVNVVIDWGRVSPEDIKVMAEYYIQYRVMHELKVEEHKLPEQITVLACDYIHQEVFVAKPINLPKCAAKPVKESKAARDLREAMEGLSKEEMLALFGGVE